MRNTVYYHTIKFNTSYFYHNFSFLELSFQVFQSNLHSFVYRERVIIISKSSKTRADQRFIPSLYSFKSWRSMQFSIYFVLKFVLVARGRRKTTFQLIRFRFTFLICFIHPTLMCHLADLFYILNVLSMETIFNFLLSRH